MAYELGQHAGNAPNTWAGIVCYRPDLEALGKLISRLEQQVAKIVIYNNGGAGDQEFTRLSISSKILVLGNAENVGIAQAVNALCATAVEHGAEFMITFDQDSTPDPRLVNRLLAFSLSLPDQQRVAAVGPYFVDHRNRKALFPVLQEGSWWIKKAYPNPAENAAIPTTLLITSGMLSNCLPGKQLAASVMIFS